MRRRAFIAGAAGLLVPAPALALMQVTQLTGFGGRSGPPSFELASHNESDAGSPYSFASSDLAEGTAFDLWVIFLSADGGSASRVASNVTIDGVSATNRGRFGSGDNCQNEVWTAAATANASGTVAFEWSGTPSRGGYCLYRVRNGFYSSTGGEASPPISVSVSMPANSVLLAGTVAHNSTGITWTGVEEDVDAALSGTPDDHHGSGSRAFLNANASHTLEASYATSGTVAAMNYVVII